MIELRFHVPDPRRRLAAVRLAHQLRERLPHELTRNGRAWELHAPAPDVARFEYQFELIDRNGASEWVLDPENPKRASGPWGFKSVWEEAGYEPPAWVTEDPVGEAEVGHDRQPHPEDGAARADLVPSRRDRAQSAARRARRA